MIYTACRYAPVELFAGFRTQVARLDPVVKDYACAEACTHPNLCGYAKALYEEIQAKHVDELVLTDCCDATRRLYDVLASEGRMKFLWLLPLPHKNGEAEIRLFAGALEDLERAYSSYRWKTFDVDLAIQAYERQRTSEEEKMKKTGTCIRIAGAHASGDLVETVEKIFPGVDVENATCTGNRAMLKPAGDRDSFFLWYADYLLNQPAPCMRMQHNGIAGETENMADNKSMKVLGTIFHTIKFCDFYSFAYLTEKTSETPLLKIETDATQQSEGQLRTRLEAFREELGLDDLEEKMTETNQNVNGPVYTAGIDSGSASTDAVILDAQCSILGRAIVPTGSGAVDGAKKALAIALEQAGLRQEDLTRIVTTGYGRSSIEIEGRAVTEITCHARGAHFLDPQVRTVIDIGGQDSKVICIDEDGRVKNFVMNDKCAAGTGRFLEMQAQAMGLTMPQMSEKGLQWKKDVTISSMCTVFAESEVVSLVAENVAVEDIIHGLNKAIAEKTAGLVSRSNGGPVFMMTGGVAQNQGVVECLSKKLNAEVRVSPDAQVCGSLGAALIALESLGIKQAE